MLQNRGNRLVLGGEDIPARLRTLLREAEQKLHSVNREDFLDAMIVLEESMRHFYSRAVQLKTMPNHDPKEVDDNLLKAVDIAEKVMPYRHHRLAAIKLDKDPVMLALIRGASLRGASPSGWDALR